MLANPDELSGLGAIQEFLEFLFPPFGHAGGAVAAREKGAHEVLPTDLLLGGSRQPLI
jgi:hypothetical protein